MDIVTVLIGVAVFILSALMLYCISAVSMREKTFEEVMEEQKRRNEEEKEKAKAGKKDKDPKKKFKKGKSDKVKPPALEPEPKVEPKMVNLEIEPEIIKPTESLLKDGVRLREKKSKNVKPILHNKEEIVPVVAKTVELAHTIVPKDEVEVKKEKGKKKEEKVAAKSKLTMESKENLPPKKVVEAPKKATPKGTPVKQVKKEDSGLVSTIKTAKLSDDEQQSIIEILMSRQGGSISDSWNKKSQKGDPVALMKRQLEEKERSLQEEQSLAMSANNKVKELRSQIGADKVKYDAIEKTYQEKLNQKHKELDALQKRVQHSHEQHMKETMDLNNKLKQMEATGGGDQANIQKLVTENKILQDTLVIKAKEMVNMQGKVKNLEKDSNPGKLQAAEAKAKAAESKVAELEKTIKASEGAKREVETLSNKKVEDVTIQLKESEAKNNSLVSDLQKATSALASTTTEVSTLKIKLEELEVNLSRADASKEAELQKAKGIESDLSGNVKNLEKQLADLTKRLKESDAEKAKLQQEKNSLSSEIKVVNEKLQAVPTTNGPSEEQEKIVSELKNQVDSQKASLTDLEKQLAQQKSKNNDDAAVMKEVENNDQAVFQRLFPAVKVSNSLAHKDWIVEFEKEAAKQFQSNKAESDGDSQRLKTEVEEYRNIVSETENKLKQLEKSIEAEEKNWEEKLKQSTLYWEEKLKTAQSTSSSSDSASESRISELETLVSDQETQMQEYRRVLSITENSLKDLESKVSSEENQWQGKLITSEALLVQSQGELADLRKQLSSSSGNQEMQAKVETLETMLKESQDKVLTLTTEKRTLEKKFESESSSDQDVSDLRAQIDSERKKNKDLCLNVVKLNGIIKTGQDALSQEQELVKKLQEQLDTKSVKSGVSEMDELDQMRSKLSEKQKLLEREMTVNKQLSERLAASSAENGTSV